MTRPGPWLSLGGRRYDPEHGELHDASGNLVRMRPQCALLLRRLALDAGHVVDKQALLEAVWPGVVVGDDSLVQCVADLRRVLGDDRREIVQTEARRGYRLVAGFHDGPEPQAPSAFLERAFVDPAYSQQVRFATTRDGVRLAWAAAGEGIPIVRAAHWMTHLDWDWRSASLGGRIHAFARTHRYVRYDMRGSGLSDRDVDPGDVDVQADDLLTVADAAGIERFVLVGISAGAAVAVRVAARRPGRVAALLLMGGFARGVLRRGTRSQSPEVFEAYARLLADGWGRDNPAARQLMTSQLYPDANRDQQRSFNEMQRLACSPEQAVRILRMVAGFDVHDDLARVGCPTLVVHARGDARVPAEEGRALAASIRDARFELLDTANHMPLPGEPAFDALTRIVDDFVGAAAPGLSSGRDTPEAAEPGPRPALRVVHRG